MQLVTKTGSNFCRERQPRLQYLPQLSERALYEVSCSRDEPGYSYSFF